MPSLTSTIDVYRSARDIPLEVFDTLESRARDANCILPPTNRARDYEENGGKLSAPQVWITSSSFQSRRRTVEFILACVDGCIGSYPIFIFTTLPTSNLTDDYILPHLTQLAEALKKSVPISRAYSVFAPEPITRLFVDIWTNLTGVQSYSDDPYYAARLTYCTKDNFKDRQMSTHPDLIYKLRPAVEEDIEEVANLCYGFAVDSEPFILTRDQAKREAIMLIQNKQVWVHHISRREDSQDGGIACIVAFTRNSKTNATITKVYTNPDWRRLGCAERLVRRVCGHLLATKESVTLFVAHDNPGAIKVYHRCGFVGLENDAAPVEGVSRWLEIGLDQDKVELGHW